MTLTSKANLQRGGGAAAARDRGDRAAGPRHEGVGLMPVADELEAAYGVGVDVKVILMQPCIFCIANH
jgi:hypothetical protein